MTQREKRQPPTVTPEQAAKALAECIAKGWVKPPATKG
jgi:hypothetical protein